MIKKIFKKNLKTKNNKGMSLIELIVTLLVSGLVMLSAVYLFQISSKGYASATAEQSLQIEAQTVSGVINDLMIEAIDYKFVSGDVYSNPALFIVVNSDTAGVYDTVCILYDAATRRLLLHRYENDATIKGKTLVDSQAYILARISDINTNYPNDFLAKFVTEFSVTPGEMSASNGLVKVYVSLQIDDSGNKFIKNINISLRNK